MPAEQPDALVVGQIVRPHGVRGEVRVQIITSHPERFKVLKQVMLSRTPQSDPRNRKVSIENARLHQGQAILKFEEIADRNEAELLRDLYVLISLEDAVPLEEGEYYVHQLIGLRMVTESGRELGEVVDLLETGANDVYIVQSLDYGELLIPAIESVIQRIDLPAGQIIVTPMPGLLPDDLTDADEGDSDEGA